MSGLNRRHYDRCDQGGSSEARPEQKMGRLRRWPMWYNPWVLASTSDSVTSGQRKTLKKFMNRKRRQRDKLYE